MAFWGASLWNHVPWARFSVVYILVQAVQIIRFDFYSKHGKKRKRLTGVWTKRSLRPWTALLESGRHFSPQGGCRLLWKYVSEDCKLRHATEITELGRTIGLAPHRCRDWRIHLERDVDKIVNRVNCYAGTAIKGCYIRAVNSGFYKLLRLINFGFWVFFFIFIEN